MRRTLYKEDCLFAKGVTSNKIEAVGGESCVLEVRNSKGEVRFANIQIKLDC